jgi:transcriptional regulatory protein LevR
VQDQYSFEYSTAKRVKEMLEISFSTSVPDDEIAFLSLFIHSTKAAEVTDKSVSIIVICHGSTIATDMVQVANTLLGVNHAQALNMPLNMNINERKTD